MIKVRLTDVETIRFPFLKVLICLLLAATVSIVYWQVIGFEFINLDDPRYVTLNPTVRHGVTLQNIGWAFTSMYFANWHPLTWISLMLDVQLFGINPGMHHLINVLFHIMNTLLLFIVLEKMTGALWRSAAVAALFALHPLHVESVAWIAERKDVLSTFFWMLTMLTYHRYVVSKTISRYLLMVLLFSLGLLAKPMLVTLPFVLLLLDFWPLKRVNPFQAEDTAPNHDKSKVGYKSRWSGLSTILQDKIPLILLAMISSGITFYAQERWGAVLSSPFLPIGIRTANAVISYITYLGKMFYPINLAVFYPYPKVLQLYNVVLCFSILLLITALVVFAARSLPYLMVGWLWYLGTLVPVIGIVQVGYQSMADRYTYLPLIGIFVMIAWGIPELMGKWQFKKIALAALTGVVVPILIVCSWKQVGYWKNSFTLFEHALNVTENNYLAHNNLAVALMERRDFDDGVKHCFEALRIKPNYADAHINLAKALIEKGDFDEALKHCAEALKINPHSVLAYNNMGLALTKKGETSRAINIFSKAIQIDSNNVLAYKSLGQAYLKQGNNSEAVKQFSKVIEIEPESVLAYINMGAALANLGRLNEAIHQYHKALQIKPDSLEAHYNLGIALLSQGKIDESIEHYKRVLKIDPGNVNAKKFLSNILANRDRLEESVASIKKVLKNGSGDSDLYVKLGDMYRSAGDIDKAVRSYEKAVSIEPRNVLALNRLAVVYSGWEEYERALNALKIVITAQPENADIYYNISCVYAKRNMVDESISWLKKSIEKGFHNYDLIKKDPDLANIRNTSYVNELLKNH